MLQGDRSRAQDCRIEDALRDAMKDLGYHEEISDKTHSAEPAFSYLEYDLPA